MTVCNQSCRIRATCKPALSRYLQTMSWYAVPSPFSCMWEIVRLRRFAVLAGDPMQLPPLIASPAQPQQRGGAPAHGLLRPLFARLMAAGHVVHLLRRQYR